ncbi:MAG: hypothetical protein AAF492_33620, partial [Verrucomicrobiota bacterium]
MWYATGRHIRQTATLDRNADGTSDEHEITYAGTRYIGAGAVPGDDAPLIGGVLPDGVNLGPSNLVLWAERITDIDDIEAVWCLITPPSLVGTNVPDQIELSWNPSQSRYESSFQGLTETGTYHFTFYARDSAGEVSQPLLVQWSGPDAFELDDDGLHAAPFEVGTIQSRNIHIPSDEDWGRFFAGTGVVYTIDVEQFGTNVDLVLDLYYEELDGNLIPVVTNLNQTGRGAFKNETVELNLMDDRELKPGNYVFRIRAPGSGGIGTDYA